MSYLARRAARRSKNPYALFQQQQQQQMMQNSGASNLSQLVNSGQTWAVSPIGMSVGQPFLGQQQQQPYTTARTRRRDNRIGGFTLSIPSNLAGIVPGVPNTSAPSVWNAFGQNGTFGQTEVKDVAMWGGLKIFLEYLEKNDSPMVKEGKVDTSKICDKTISIAKKQSEQKDKILAFTNKAETDQWAKALSPEFGQIMMTEPVQGVYLSPMHYVEALRIASLSTQSIGLGITSATGNTPCDDARKTIQVLSAQPYASIVRNVAATCAHKKTDWYKIETARGRFWFYLWLALWAKFTQNNQLTAALMGTGNKLLIYYDDDNVYGIGSDPTIGSNAAGFLMMLIRGFIAAGFISINGKPVNPGYLFDQWVKPVINAVYDNETNLIKTTTTAP